MSEEEKNVYKNLFEYPTKIITSLELEKENLIEYLEDRINFLNKIDNPNNIVIGRRDEMKDLLERVKSGKYE